MQNTLNLPHAAHQNGLTHERGRKGIQVSHVLHLLDRHDVALDNAVGDGLVECVPVAVGKQVVRRPAQHPQQVLPGNICGHDDDGLMSDGTTRSARHWPFRPSYCSCHSQIAPVATKAVPAKSGSLSGLRDWMGEAA